jgi:DNA-binding PadR family transcriptional regulator
VTELTLHVLLAIGDGAAHGYAIGKDVEERSGGRLDPTTGALYQVLKRLQQDQMIQPVPPPGAEPVDPRRKYFVLTAAGRDAVTAEIGRLNDVVQLARRRRLFTGAR